MRVHLIDGTYELFRAFYGAPSVQAPDGMEVAAARTFMRSLWGLVQDEEQKGEGAYVAVAFDHVIESFRNGLFEGYKTGEGIDPELWGQAPLVEQVCEALGVVAWPMVEFEADDALAAGAALYAKDNAVSQVRICTPDKDLAQCVRGDRVVQLDRRKDELRDEAGVVAKFGVEPGSIPDYLALVGDDADGIPGIPRWGAKSTASVLARWKKLEAIPADPTAWEIKVRGAARLSEELESRREAAALYRTLATLREDVPLSESVQDLRWQGARQDMLEALCERIGDERFFGRAKALKRWR